MIYAFNDNDLKSVRKTIFVFASIIFIIIYYDPIFKLPESFVLSNQGSINIDGDVLVAILLFLQVYLLVRLVVSYKANRPLVMQQWTAENAPTKLKIDEFLSTLKSVEKQLPKFPSEEEIKNRIKNIEEKLENFNQYISEVKNDYEKIKKIIDKLMDNFRNKIYEQSGKNVPNDDLLRDLKRDLFDDLNRVFNLNDDSKEIRSSSKFREHNIELGKHMKNYKSTVNKITDFCVEGEMQKLEKMIAVNADEFEISRKFKMWELVSFDLIVPFAVGIVSAAVGFGVVYFNLQL